MKNILILLITILTSGLSHAQFIKSRSVSAQIGYGITIPYYSLGEIADDGFFLQGEYVLHIASWVQLKPYAGFISTNSNGRDMYNNTTEEKAEIMAVMIGGKARVKVPIRWVAPYVEAGIGSSIGKFETFTVFTDENRSGILYHIPLSIGLELGPKNNVDLGFVYYFHPTVEQVSGAFTVGITIPLRS